MPWHMGNLDFIAIKQPTEKKLLVMTVIANLSLRNHFVYNEVCQNMKEIKQFFF